MHVHMNNAVQYGYKTGKKKAKNNTYIERINFVLKLASNENYFTEELVGIL